MSEKLFMFRGILNSLGVTNMKKIKFLFLASLILLFTTFAFNSNSTVSASKNNYPDITTKYDTNNMSQYSDDDMGEYVTMNKFYVQAISYDKHHKERIIFTNTPQSKTYYFTVLQGNKHHKRIAVGDTITVKGMVGTRETIEKTQANSWFAKKFFGQQAFFVLTDSYK